MRFCTGLPLDKEAASRFVKAGIANQPSKPSDSSTFYSAEATVTDPLAGPGPHSRLSSLARISTPTEQGESSAQASSSSSSSDSEAELKIHDSMVASTSVQTQQVEEPAAEAAPSESTSAVDNDKKKRRQEKKRKRLLGVDAETPEPRKMLLDPLLGMSSLNIRTLTGDRQPY